MILKCKCSYFKPAAVEKRSTFLTLAWATSRKSHLTPADGNRRNNGVDTLSCLCTLCDWVCMYVCVRAGWRAAWQVGGSHLFPALQQLSSRTFLHLVPVTDPSGVCNLYFGSVRTAISSFPLVSWRVQTLIDLWKMVTHVRANCQGNQGLHNIWYNDAGFRRPTGTLILPAEMLWQETRTTTTLLFLHLFYF